MGFTYTWDDPDNLSVMRFTATDPWTWNDYHKAVRMALFTLHNHPQPVDLIIDLSPATRLPGGALAHVRSFGKRLNPSMTGRVIVIGLDAEIEARLRAGRDERVLQMQDRTIYFADDEAAAQAILSQLRDA